MKKFFCLVIAVALITSLFVPLSVMGAEVLLEESFEGGIDKLIPESDVSLPYLKITDKVHTEGGSALFVFDNGMDYSVKANTDMVPALAKTTYTVTGDIFTCEGEVRLYIRFFDADKKALSQKSVTGTADSWEGLAVSMEAPDKTAYACASVGFTKMGTGWGFSDNIKIFKGEAKGGSVTGANPSDNITASLMAPADGVAEGTVLLYDSFEEGYEKNWTLYGANSEGRVFISDSVSYEGKKALFINDDVEGGTAGIKSEKIPVTPGNVYTLYANMKAVSGKNLRIYYRIYDGSGATLKSTALIPEGDLWQAMSSTLYAPEGSEYIQLVIAGMGSLKGEVYFDNLSLLKGASKPKDPKVTNPWEVADGERIFYEDFEEGFSKWSFHTTKSQEVIASDTEIVYEGKKSVKINDSDSGGPGIKSPLIPVAEGSLYTANAMLYLKEGDGLKLFFRIYDENKKQIASTSVNTQVGNWENATAYLQAPEEAAYCQAVIAGLGANTGVLYADKVEIYKGTFVPEKTEDEFIPPIQSPAVDARVVAPVNGGLVYTPYSDKGDIIGDYSYAGFFNGEYNLPVTANLPVVMEIAPTGTGDDTAHIQAAIDKVSEASEYGPMRVLKLKAGKYYINKTGLKMKSGVILSGEGQGPEGTNLYAFEPVKYTVVSYFGEDVEAVGEKIYLTDSYIPSGAKTLHISEADANKLSVGEEIFITQNSTDKWAEALEMLGMVDIYGGDSSWHEGKIPMLLERTITAINGTEITLDFGVHMPYMAEYAPMYICRTGDEGRIENSGIENLRIESYYNGIPTDENHANNAITIARSKNIFVRDVTTKHFSNYGISCQYKAKQVTVLNCSYIEPICASGSAKRYAFTTSRSSQLLYTGCYTNDALIAYGTGYPCTGPVSFVDNVNDQGASTVETHGTWSTAILFDNIYNVPGNALATISLANNGKYGTSSTASQGWTTAGSIAWNCLSSGIVVQDVPLGYENFGIGIFGHYTDEGAKASKDKRIERTVVKYKTSKTDECPPEAIATDDNTPFIGDGYFEAKYTPVNPRSLFKAQLSERFTGSILNAKPNAPVINYPKADKLMSSNDVTISGMCQLGAEKVTVYIDNIPYNAPIGANNIFSLTVNLKNGNHKIYATQTIDGVEGCKNADRFITVKESDGNPEYLKSVYGIDKTSMLVNDPRPAFDEIVNGVKVFTDGDLLVSDVRPLNQNGRVLVPMRAIFEKLRASISWDAGTETATAIKDGIEVKITKNQTTAYKNGEPIILDVPATILNGRFVVPVRFISESFGCQVGWVSDKNAVTVKIPKDNGIKAYDGVSANGGRAIASVTQSGDDGYGSNVSRIFDNDKNTLWMARCEDESNPPYIIIDLGENASPENLEVSFYQGKSRTYYYSVYTSTDNVSFAPLMTDKSTTRVDGFEKISLKGMNARYIKLVVKGSSFGSWALIEELRIK